MKIRYVGREPIANVFGRWSFGDVKEIPDNVCHTLPSNGFVPVPVFCGTNHDLVVPMKKRGRPRKVKKEKLKDKMEKNSVVIEDGD